MSIRPLLIALVAGCTACASAPSRPQDGPAASAPAADLSEFIRLYRQDQSDVSRFYDTPWSELRQDRLEREYKKWQESLAAVNFASLDQQGKIDHILMRNKLILERRRLELDRRRLKEMDDLLPFRGTIQDLHKTMATMDAMDPEKAATLVAALPAQIKKLREGVKSERDARKDADKEGKKDQPDEPNPGGKAGPPAEPIIPSPVVAQRAASAVGAIRRTLSEWFRFYDGYQPSFSWWVRKPFDEADKALDEYAKYLRETVAGLKGEDEDPLIGDPIGTEALAADLAYEMIPYSPEQLIAIGEREFVWCEAEIKKASAEMGCGEDWKAALAKVKADHVPPGEQDELVEEQSRFAIQFLKDKDLVTIPPLCEETWRLTMISPQVQKVLPFAAYGGQNMMVAYPTDAMKHEDKLMSMRGNNRHFMRSVTFHELIPGHHLQGFMADRIRPYRGIFSTPFFGEGWCLHWEMLFYDLGFAGTPQERMGMMFWRMHRCARIIISLKFHLNQMKPAEMVDFLVERVGHERFGATSEVRRYINGDYSPLYQCGYMIGGLQVRAMHKELVGSGKMTHRQFHDAVLTYGTIPVELIRAGMVNVPLTADATATWKFAGDVH